ncbi:MAG: response regulator [Desulfocapsaceae bacterium]|nr:response regulator [Desulfocapsaceae bacterium]
MKILIVEDDQDSRLVLQKALQSSGYEVEAAVHGAEALEMAHASIPDLIISDILMPVMDGYQLCYALKHDEKLRRVPLVFYTATYVDLEDERLAIGLGASRFVLKPMDPAEFMKVIQEVIEEAARGEMPVPDEPVDDPVELFRKFDSSLSRKLEDKVRELDLYRRVFENSQEALVVVDRTDTITRINKAYEELLGFPQAELMSASPETYLNEDSLTPLRQSLAETGFAQGEAKVRHSSGKEIPVWYMIFPVKNEYNERTAHVWVLQDISKRVEAEKQQRLFRTLVDYSNDAIFVINPQTAAIVDANERACNRLHYSLQELVGKTALDLDAVMNTMEQWQEHVAQVKKVGALMFDSAHRRKDGSEFPVEINVVYTETDDGDYMVAVARDITERKRAEAQLHLAQQEWDRTFDAISDVVTVQDLDMRIIQANKATSDLFQMPIEQIIGKHCHELFGSPGAGICPNCPIPRVRDFFVPHMTEVEHPLLHKTFQVTIVPILDKQGNIMNVVHFAKDISEQKNLAAQLLQSQKIESVGKLAGGVAHDFNNMLHVISGYLDLVMRRLSPDDPVTADLLQVKGAADRAANLVRQLLLFSRKQPMEFKEIDLNSTINELIKMLQRIIGENIHLQVELNADDYKIMGDAANIDQVLMNLVVNGRDSMPQGGTITIKTEHLFLDDDYCRQNLEARPGSFICLSISDTGTGMSAEVRGHIFEPFFTTKEVGKGTGLGLAVVYGIVKSHKGWITVYSEEGQGTCFRVYLPALSIEEETKKISAAADLMKEHGNGEKILVVEDDEGVRGLITKVLTTWGYVVETAENAETALEMVTSQTVHYDMVFSDVILPNMSGVDLAEKIRALQPTLPIILCSGYADLDTHWPKVKALGLPFLEKPLSMDKLLKTVHDALKKNA